MYVAKLYPWEDRSLEGLAIDPLVHEEWKRLANFPGKTLNHSTTEEPSELKKKGGRPKVYNTKEEKLASRRIPVENKKPIGRPRRFPTPQAKIESRRKTP